MFLLHIHDVKLITSLKTMAAKANNKGFGSDKRLNIQIDISSFVFLRTCIEGKPSDLHLSPLFVCLLFLSLPPI